MSLRSAVRELVEELLDWSFESLCVKDEVDELGGVLNPGRLIPTHAAGCFLSSVEIGRSALCLVGVAAVSVGCFKPEASSASERRSRLSILPFLSKFELRSLAK